MALNLLTYPVSRPFPFKWFHVFVFVEFLIAIVIFSLVSFATSGYDLVSIYSSNPNVTEAQRAIPGVPDIIMSKARASCQSINIDVGSTFATNNSAIHYTLDSVQNKGLELGSSLVYHNNKLEDCHLNNIMVQIQSLDRTPSQVAAFTYGLEMTASITCSVSTKDMHHATFNLSAQYDYIPPNVGIGTGETAFLGRNRTASTSLYYAETGLAMYYVGLLVDFAAGWDYRITGEDSFWEAILHFNRSRNATDDVRSLDYYEGSYRLIRLNNDGRVARTYNIGDPMPVSELIAIENREFWGAADKLAKIFESTVMTDLGQVSYQPNVLTDPSLVNWFTANYSQIDTKLTAIENEAWYLPLPDHHDLNAEDEKLLGVNPSVLALTYLCQVPQRKGFGDLFISVLIADLVLLQALWTITMFVATMLAERKDPQANFCDGCAQSRITDHGIAPAKYISLDSSDRNDNTELGDMQRLVLHPSLTVGKPPYRSPPERP